MNKKPLDVLKELKNDFDAVSLKAEIANEVISQEELYKIKELADSAGLMLSLKTGGCEAGNDILLAKNIGANSIVAPMIETPYALKKFVNKVFCIFNTNELQNIKLHINIETISAYKNLDEILSLPDIDYINGIILGRDDIVGSMNLSRENVNSERILELAKNIAIKLDNANKEYIIGGEIRANSFDFLNELKKIYLTKYETRKIIFNTSEQFSEAEFKKGIHKALEFEILWLEYRNEFNGFLYPEDEKRLSKLKYLTLNS